MRWVMLAEGRRRMLLCRIRHPAADFIARLVLGSQQEGKCAPA